MEQFNSGESSFIFEINSHKYSIGLISVGNLVWQQEEAQKGDISVALIILEQFFKSVLFKDTQDVISLIFLLQDNVIIQSGLFPTYLPKNGCAFSLHSIINNGLIPEGQDSSRRQTVFFLPIVPRDKDHEDLEH